jgi:hypothetical protein
MSSYLKIEDWYSALAEKAKEAGHDPSGFNIEYWSKYFHMGFTPAEAISIELSHKPGRLTDV